MVYQDHVKKKNFLVRLFCIFIPPIIIILLLFPFPGKKISLKDKGFNISKGFLTEGIGKQEEFKFSEESILPPTLKNIIADIIRVPLNLEWYFICFQSYDNRYIIPEAPKTAEWISKMTITSPYSSDSIELINNQEECIKYNDKAGFNYNITLSSGVGFKLSSDWQSITFDNTKNLKWDVYAMPVFKHLITQYIIIFLAWWAMILLFVGIWKFLVRGI